MKNGNSSLVLGCGSVVASEVQIDINPITKAVEHHTAHGYFGDKTRENLSILWFTDFDFSQGFLFSAVWKETGYRVSENVLDDISDSERTRYDLADIKFQKST